MFLLRIATHLYRLDTAAERDYYVGLPEDYTITGRKLYNWLDGSDRLLSRTMQQHPGESLILAIAAAESLAHLPWEMLMNLCCRGEAFRR